MRQVNPIRFFLLLFLLTQCDGVIAQRTISPDSILHPSPTPFSLDGQSAVYCKRILRNNFILELQDDGKYTTIMVKTVQAQFLNWDTTYPLGMQKRYDILINGHKLDWNKTYIQYGKEMINLRVLFTYKNQQLPEDLEKYKLGEDF
ncbi:hypothetical protein [Spirochaeta cellobiosiphila]|uniref:hypothetical protein n=1 Tax=Spirochaeta cellobiosiphila TaxID=504483 RepID=UPI0003F7824A|nr:hypothetical protein [Spirochaeta cellobiosiphila]